MKTRKRTNITPDILYRELAVEELYRDKLIRVYITSGDKRRVRGQIINSFIRQTIYQKLILDGKRKVCISCNLTKKITDFYLHNQTYDGYMNVCKECKKQQTKINKLKRKNYGNRSEF